VSFIFSPPRWADLAFPLSPNVSSHPPCYTFILRTPLHRFFLGERQVSSTGYHERPLFCPPLSSISLTPFSSVLSAFLSPCPPNSDGLRLTLCFSPYTAAVFFFKLLLDHPSERHVFFTASWYFARFSLFPFNCPAPQKM